MSVKSFFAVNENKRAAIDCRFLWVFIPSNGSQANSYEPILVAFNSVKEAGPDMAVEQAHHLRELATVTLLLLTYGALTAQPLGSDIDPRCFDVCRDLCKKV